MWNTCIDAFCRILQICWRWSHYADWLGCFSDIAVPRDMGSARKTMKGHRDTYNARNHMENQKRNRFRLKINQNPPPKKFKNLKKNGMCQSFSPNLNDLKSPFY